MRTFWLVTMILGFALEGCGFVLAARGLLQTWQANAGDRQFFSPRFQRIFAWVRVHLLRKPGVPAATATFTAQRQARDALFVGVVERASTDEMTVEERLEVIHDISVEARREASAAVAAVEKEARERRAAVTAIESRLDVTSKELTAHAERLVVDGVPLAVAGLVSAAAGLTLQAAASIAVF